MNTNRRKPMSFFVSFGLALICLFLIVYANAQRTIAIHALEVSIIQRDKADSAVMVAFECEQQGILALEKARQAFEAAEAQQPMTEIRQ